MKIAHSTSGVFFSACLSYICSNIVFGVSKNIIVTLAVGAGCMVVFRLLNVRGWHMGIYACAYVLSLMHFSTIHIALSENELIDVIESQQDVSIDVLVRDEPIQRDGRTTYRVQPISINGNEINGGKVELILYTDSLVPYTFGDQLVVSGKVDRVPSFDGFNYQQYMLKDRVVGILYSPRIIRKNAAPWSIVGEIFKIKENLRALLYSRVPEPEASLLGGLLIGERSGLSEKITNDFNRTGLTHIVAISGYNIALIVTIISQMGTRFINRRHLFYLIIGALIFFVIITGSSASVVRAAIMGSVVLGAKHFGRVASMHVVFAITALAMAIHNPYVLTHDVGFQLSFVSTVGIVYLAELFEYHFKWIPNICALRESLSLTIIALLVTFPITILNFKTLSTVSILVNIVVAPLVPYATIIGALSVSASFVKVLSTILFYFSYAFLHTIIMIISFFSQWTYAQLQIPNTAVFVLLLVWSVIFIRILYAQKTFQTNS